MPFSFLPPLVATFLLDLGSWLDRRTAPRVAAVACGVLFAKGRRTVTSWLRAAGVAADFRRAYSAVNAVGRESASLAFFALRAAAPALGRGRLLVAVDDTPTRRYGPAVEGAGRHRHPSPGPADGPFLYGHVFVTLAVLARHPRDGTVALPIRGTRYRDRPSRREAKSLLLALVREWSIQDLHSREMAERLAGFGLPLTHKTLCLWLRNHICRPDGNL